MSSAVPAGWEVTKLGEHTNRFYQGINTVADKVVYQIDGIPILQAKHITSGVITFGGAKFLDVETYRKYREKFQPQESDILFTNIGTIGKSVLVQKPSKYLIAWNIFLIGLKVETNPKYFNLFLQKLDSDQYFEDLMTGNATKFINKSNLYDIPFLTPPLPEQKKIASILTSVDEVIENTQKQIDKLQDLKKATMNELLTKGIGHTEFKDSELGRIPNSWEVTELGNLIGSLNGGVSVNSENRHKVGSEIGVLKTSCISNGKFFAMEHKAVLKEDIHRVTTPVEAETILFSRMNTPNLVGESGYVEHSFSDLYLPDRLWALKLRDKSDTSVRWLSWLLVSRSVKTDISNAATGTSGSMKNISKPNLLSIKVRKPPINEQLQIASVINSIEDNKVSSDKKMNILVSLKKSLMQDLLTGKVRVTVN